MMDNKLSELSKPTAFVVTGGTLYQDRALLNKSMAERYSADRNDGSEVEPLYSQEYVSALQQKIAELEQAMRHIHGAALDITVPRVAIAKAAELAVEHAAMKEQSNG
ncbi:TPA: hypothetical protein ACQVG6_003492 [Serratia marcescens]